MPRWLQGMVLPTLTLWFFAMAAMVAEGVSGGNLPVGAELLMRFTMSLVVAFWVMSDAHKRGLRLCYDYDLFVFIAWQFVVPVYLFRTRGLKAFLTLLCFAGIWFA